MSEAELARRGWTSFAQEDAVSAWVDHVRPYALATADDWVNRSAWLRHGDTWFAGVNVLQNDRKGKVAGGPALTGSAVDTAKALSPQWSGLDQGQVSICYPGFPADDGSESATAHNYRVKRDGAHLDGLHRHGAERRRYLREYHAFILGLPLDDPGADAAPFCLWEGSHVIMGRMLAEALGNTPSEQWGEVDLTLAYLAARQACFRFCKRVEISLPPGSAFLAHRFALHGVAPWRAGSGQRAIVYFRPQAKKLARSFLEIK